MATKLLPTSTTDARIHNVTVNSVFVRALWGVMRGWTLAATVACLLQAWWSPKWAILMLVIALGSGLIAVMSMLPGIFLRVPKTESLPHEPFQKTAMTAHLFLLGSVAAMAIRFVGTVALFAACRYQFELPAKTIAVFVCSWYVLLTSIEILCLAREAASIDSASDSRLDYSHSPSTDSTFG